MKILSKIRLLSKGQLGIIVIVTLCVTSILGLMLNPAARKGPFGFGPPAPMTTFKASDNSYSILYPENWVARETPQGSQDDSKIIAVIVVSGQQYGIVNIARESFPDGNVDQVIEWGQSRAAEHINYAPFPLEAAAGNTNNYVQEYTWGNSTLKRCQDLYVYASDNGYAVSFCSYDSKWSYLESYFLTMMQSFSVQGK